MILLKYIAPIFMFLIFIIIGITLFITKQNLFYLFNFGYIGFSISLGIFLYIQKVKVARRIVQFLVGSYMLLYLGIIYQENMQIEGFWFYLFTGVFEAATIHYVVAKIFGSLIFGRGWCGYACWTAIVLDLLPFKTSSQRKNLSFINYISFLLSFTFVLSLFLMNVFDIERIMFISFIIGNLCYYAIELDWLLHSKIIVLFVNIYVQLQYF